MRFILPVLLVLCSTLRSPAQKIDIECKGCTVSTHEVEHIRKVAEFESAFFKGVFGERRKEHAISIHIYEDQKAFLRAQRRSMWHIISETGVYNPIWNTVLVHKWARYLQTCYHESSHAIYDHYAPFRPSWIDEGMAEHFKSAQFDSLENITLSGNPSRRKDMKQYVADSAFSVEKVLRASHRKFHTAGRHYYYSMSWGIVYFLRMKNDTVFKEILRRVSKGRCSVKVVDEEYPGGMEQLRKDLIEYYK